jgi:hypothetical protein
VLNQWFLASDTLYKDLITFRIEPFFNLSSCSSHTKKSLFRCVVDWT